MQLRHILRAVSRILTVSTSLSTRLIRSLRNVYISTKNSSQTKADALRIVKRLRLLTAATESLMQTKLATKVFRMFRKTVPSTMLRNLKAITAKATVTASSTVRHVTPAVTTSVKSIARKQAAQNSAVSELEAEMMPV